MTTKTVDISHTDKTILKALEQIGLTSAQAMIYIFLIQNDASRIQDIVYATHIPRTSVYDDLHVLIDLGLATKILDQTFTKIKANPIGILRHNFQQQLFEMQQSIARLDDLEEQIQNLEEKRYKPQTIISYYTGISGARQIFWNTLKAKNTMYVYSAYDRVELLGSSFYTDFAQESKNRKITERVLINPTQKALTFIREKTGSPISRTKIEDLKYLPETELNIQGEALIYNNIYAQVNIGESEVTGFEIQGESFVLMQQTIYEILWNSAHPVSEIIGGT